MRVPIHIKSTLFVIVIIKIVMVVMFFIFGSIVVNRMQEEQKQYAEAQAENLSEKIADALPRKDYDTVVTHVQILDSARKSKSVNNKIRVWDVDGTTFYKRVEAGEGESVYELPAEIKNALLNGQEAKIEDTKKSVYRVIVPVKESNNIVGAVEFAEQLDTFSSWSARYRIIGISLVLGFIILSALGVYAMTRIFVNRPLNKIKTAMERFKAGDLKARTHIKNRDEFGELGTDINLMLEKSEEFIEEREKLNEILEVKVKEATSELETRNEQLERANREIWQTTKQLTKSEKFAAAGQTAAQFAHEVGTPLNLISGHVQLLQREIDKNEAAKKRLGIIGLQIERIKEIVLSMLDKTRYGDVKYEPLDVNKIIESVLQIVSPKLESDDISVTFQPTENLPPITANTERLQQIFLNLINNADDAMPGGGELRIKTFTERSQVVVEIKDNGGGMSEETRKRIFEPLFTTKERGHGTGLGLVVVKQILSEQNASIEVESEKDKGTTFLLYFPKSET